MVCLSGKAEFGILVSRGSSEFDHKLNILKSSYIYYN